MPTGGWKFTISPVELWRAVEAGIAVIGQADVAQESGVRWRKQAAHAEITNFMQLNGGLSLPPIALFASARA